MNYEGIIYRPPSEARSFILQVTVGCSHNKCSFCTMYKDKKFRIKSNQEIFRDIDEVASRYADYEMKVFLADGDALVLATDRLVEIIGYIKCRLPYVSRITSYGTARDILNKSDADLTRLKEAGLEMIYVGAESGSPKVLGRVYKDITTDELIEAAEKLKKAKIKLSLTLISGLGGKELLHEHAIESAKLVSKMKPDYLGFLTLMLDESAPIMKDIHSGAFQLLSPEDVVEEMKQFLSNVDSEGTVFRANHASNYMMLKGNLNTDIEAMLSQISTIESQNKFRPESFRRL